MIPFLDEAKTYAILGLVIALVALGGYHYVSVAAYKVEIAAQESKISMLEEENNRLTLDLNTAVVTNEKLAKEIALQNEAVQTYIDAALAANESAKAAIARAKADAVTWKKKYETILHAPPVNPEDLCESADIRMSQYITERAGEDK